MRCAQRREVRVYSEPRSTVPPGPSTFPRRTQCQREKGLRNGKAEAPPVLSFGGGAFSDLRKGHQRSSEDPKFDQVAQWRWRFFGSREKKTTGGSVLNAFPESATSARQLPALASLACRIGLQRGESGTKAECIHVGIWDAPQQGLHLHAPA